MKSKQHVQKTILSNNNNNSNDDNNDEDDCENFVEQIPNYKEIFNALNILKKSVHYYA